MSDSRTHVKARLAYARKELMGAVARLDQSMVDWAPSSGMRTIGGQLIEIGGAEWQVLCLLTGQPNPSDDQISEKIGGTGNLATLLAFVASMRSNTLAYLDALSDQQLDENIETPKWHESMGLESASRAELLVGVALHETYHTAQLVSYLWTRGDDPYKW